MVKKQQAPISKADWKDLRIRKETANSLQYIKLENDLLTYDDAIQLLLQRYKFQ
jgi:hypothetical protein